MLDRYHTTSIGPDEEALRAAFLKCGELMKVRGGAVMGLAVHTKNNLDGAIRSVFGEDVVRVLDRDNKLDLKGIVIHLLTETGVDGSTEPGDLQKNLVFSYQFQEWIVGELNNLSISNGANNDKLTRLIGFFSDPNFSKIELKPSGVSNEFGGLISFSLKDAPPDTDQTEVIAFPMQIPTAPETEVPKEQVH